MIETSQSNISVSEEALNQWLKDRLSEERYHHSLGAQQKAVELAKYFKLSTLEIQKAAVAGLLHDCAKLMSPSELIDACDRFQIPIADEDRESPQTLHPFVGAALVKQDFWIADDEILNAIRYHTTGRRGMSDVEKVVYIADKIEENTRNPLYTQKIAALINSHQKEILDKVVLYIMDTTMTFLIEKGQLIHPRTLDARNEIVTRLKALNTLVSNRR